MGKGKKILDTILQAFRPNPNIKKVGIFSH
jgi:hypothetical protein